MAGHGGYTFYASTWKAEAGETLEFRPAWAV